MAKVRGTDGDDRLHGRNLNDEIEGRGGDDRLAGRGGDDTLAGGSGDDLLIGGGGRDSLFGGAGDDILRGGSRSEEAGSSTPFDTLDGGNGDDKLYGGYRRDTLTGGDGADRFVYRSVDDSSAGDDDTITDFQEGVDKLALHGEFRHGAGPLHLIGSQAFSGVAGEVRFEANGGGSVVQIDVDGDAQVDFVIHFNGEIQFQQRDFLF